MGKTFDANVSRMKPRTRLSALLSKEQLVPAMSAEAVESIAASVASEPFASLSQSVKQRAAERAFKPTAIEVLKQAIGSEAEALSVHSAPTPPVATTVPRTVLQSPPPAVVAERPSLVRDVPVEGATRTTPPAETDAAQKTVGVSLETGSAQPVPAERRERLKARLKAVREHPRPEPLPDTVAEAGVLAVERIAALQTELTKVRALNLALTQDLEASRRQAERSTEEARTRMDEARRLATEMEGRATLLSELEGELASLEAERNEALLTLQDARTGLDAAAKQRAQLQQSLDEKTAEVEECLSEEERLAADVETAQNSLLSAERANAVLKTERDTLARQVADLTRERAELLEARKALEAVHRALSQAVAK
jgi:predicted  nucleic acid-binding Zn-ribbon protein